jgi:Protein of unknown function (DUF3237)
MRFARFGFLLSSLTIGVGCGGQDDANLSLSGSGGIDSGSSDASGGNGELPPGGSGGTALLGSGGGSVTGGATSTGGETNGLPTGGAASLVEGTFVPDPSWTCGMPEGIVDPAAGELVFRTTISTSEVHDVGTTQYGERSFTVLNNSSSAEGKLQATFLSGGLDFELTLSNGTREVEQVAMLKGSDGSLIYLRTCGLALAGSDSTRIVPDFEVAKSSSLAWLNSGAFVGTRTLDQEKKTIEFAVYDVSMLAADGDEVVWTDPSDAVDQPWDCLVLNGTQGAQVFTETVTLGASQSVGESKRGTRNVIPITGGSVTGKLTGSVVSAGADYQLIGGQTTLDARYVLEANDGEFVIVRNCGPFGKLIPAFEARTEGPFSFLNANRFISSNPGSAAGGVSITFYELN